jgi:hypothetical protein
MMRVSPGAIFESGVTCSRFVFLDEEEAFRSPEDAASHRERLRHCPIVAVNGTLESFPLKRCYKQHGRHISSRPEAALRVFGSVSLPQAFKEPKI